MEQSYFFQIVLKKWKVIMLSGIICAVAAYLGTKRMKDVFTSETLIYTGLASGYNIESGENNRTDYFAINNAFDNLINLINARETKEEVGMKLLASHLHMLEPDSMIISEESFLHLKEVFPAEYRLDVVDSASIDNTFLAIKRIRESMLPHPVNTIMDSDDEIYSYEQISKANFKRIASSDMIKGSYTMGDRGVCRHTLNLLIEVISIKFSNIKKGETHTVVDYFEKQTEEVYSQLTSQENNLKAYRAHNQIVDYQEQAKSISSQKDMIEQDLQQEKMNLVGAQASLKRLENQLSSRERIRLSGQNITEKRSRISTLTNEIAYLEGDYKKNNKRINQLKLNLEEEKAELEKMVHELYLSSNSVGGVSVSQLLDKWLNYVVTIEESKAKVEVLSEQKASYGQTFRKFAPIGSQLKRYDRQINLLEQQYMQLLNGLNLSKMRLKNIELSSGLKVIDAPNYPFDPVSSKKMIIVGFSGVSGVVMSLFLLLLFELKNNAIRTKFNMQKVTGLEVIAGLPLYNNKKMSLHNRFVLQRMLETISEYVEMLVDTKEQLNIPNNVIVVSSIKTNEGKTMLVEAMVKYFNLQGVKTIGLVNRMVDGENTMLRQVEIADLDLRTRIFANADKDLENYELIVLEIPAFITFEAPTKLLKHALMHLHVADAKQVWSQSDSILLNRYKQRVGEQIYGVINKVSAEVIDEFIGKIPKSKKMLREMLSIRNDLKLK